MNGNDRAIVGLVTLAHAMVHTYELSIPILVPIWLDAFPVTGAQLGLVVAAGYALFGLGALPGGIVADAVGSRRLIVACLLGMALSFLLLAVAPSVPAVAFALLVWGAAASVYHPSGLSLISRGVEARGSAFAYHGIAGNLGIALGPLATTLLLLVVGWRTAVALLALPAVLAAAFAFRARVDESAAVADGTEGPGDADEPNGTDTSRGATSKADAGVSSLSAFLAESRALFAGSFAVVFLVVLANGLYYRGLLTFLPELLSGFESFAPIQVAGRALQPSRYFYAGLLLVGVAGQYVGGRLTDRVRVERAIAAAYAVLALLALVFLPVADLGIGPFLLLGAVLGFFLFVVQPLYQAMVAEHTPAGTRGLSYGYTYLGNFGIGALGAGVAGVVLQYWTPLVLFVVLAGFAAVGAALAGVLSLRGA